MRVLFLLLVVLVASASAIAFIEPLVLWCMERLGLTRPQAALACSGAAWLLGLVVILSFSYWSFEFSFFGVMKKLGMFDVLLIATHVLPILSATATAAFVGWKLYPSFSREALRIRSLCVYDVWVWSLRVIAPALLLVILLSLPRLFL